MNALTTTERHDLDGLEAVVSQGLGTFRQVGEALAEIRGRKLYRGTHATWDDYLRGRWGLSRSYVGRLIQGAEIAGQLSPVGNPPDCEAQVRPLAALDDPDDRRDVWAEACAAAEAGRPTAAEVERITREALGGLSPGAKLAAAEREEDRLRARAEARRGAEAKDARAARVEQLVRRVRQAIRLARGLGGEGQAVEAALRTALRHAEAM